MWPPRLAPPASELLSWSEVVPPPRTEMPVAFSLPSIVTLMVLPNWLLPRVLRSISPSRMPVASPLRSTASAGWLALTTPEKLSEPP